MNNISDQHTAAFANVQAFVIIGANGGKLATVALKYPKDGAGRLWAYVHVIGSQMARGSANGYGYDKASAAVCAALAKWAPRHAPSGGVELDDYEKEARARFAMFKAAATSRDGYSWAQNLENAGFTVLQAV